MPRWRLRLRALAKDRTLPDFACVGPIKSGTTDLSSYLFQHPCILPPLSKEIFSINPKEWPPYYPTDRERERITSLHGKALSGYFYPALHNSLLVDNYKAAKPDAKIVLVLRNPVDRAFSHYKWDMFTGNKGLTSRSYYSSFTTYIDQALKLFPAPNVHSACGWPILQTGIYANSVGLWIDRFGQDNCHVLRAEDFFADTASSVCGIHEFLGIPAIKPEIFPVVHENPITFPPMEDETRAKLMSFYEPWNQQLYQLLGRDMGWDKPRTPKPTP